MHQYTITGNIIINIRCLTYNYHSWLLHHISLKELSQTDKLCHFLQRIDTLSQKNKALNQSI